MTRKRIAVTVAVMFAALGLWAAPTGAAAPRQQGWWSASPVARPDVPEDGLLVEGGATSPASFAALVYDVSSNATVGKLKLAVAPSSATIPNVTLQLCPLAEPAIEPAQGGAMADAPEFDCATNVTAQPGSDGTTYEFDVASLLGNGVLAVAIMGTTPADRVVLSAPDANSLPVEQTSTAGTGDSGSFADSGAGSTSADRAFTPPTPADGVTSSPPPAPSVPGGGSTASDRNDLGAGVAVSDTSSPDDETAENRELLFLLLGAAVVVGAWLAIGRSAASRAAGPASVAASEGVSH